MRLDNCLLYKMRTVGFSSFVPFASWSVRGAGRERSGRSSYFVVLCLTVYFSSAVQVLSGSVSGIFGKMACDYLKYVHHWAILAANSGIKWDLVTHSSVMLLSTSPLCPVNALQ